MSGKRRPREPRAGQLWQATYKVCTAVITEVDGEVVKLRRIDSAGKGRTFRITRDAFCQDWRYLGALRPGTARAPQQIEVPAVTAEMFSDADGEAG